MTTSLNIVLASHTIMGGTFKVGSHHLAETFEHLGHKVQHISTPITPFHALRAPWSASDRLRFKSVLTNIAGKTSGAEFTSMSLLPSSVTRFLPSNLSSGFNPLLQTIPSFKRVSDYFDGEKIDLLFVDQPRLAGIEDILHPKTMIYRPTDLYSELLMDTSILSAEATLAEKASGWIVTSHLILDHLRSIASDTDEKPHLVTENGVDYDHFSVPQPEPEDLAAIPCPRLIYAGALDHRFDFDLVEQVAAGNPRLSLIIIGPVPKQYGKRLRGENIYRLGARAYRSIPAYFQHCDLGVLPLNDHPSNEARSPMKLYEYAASGLPVITTETREIKSRNEPFVFISPTGDHRRFSDLVDTALDFRSKSRNQIRDAAQSRNWTSIANRILAFTDDLTVNASE